MQKISKQHTLMFAGAMLIAASMPVVGATKPVEIFKVTTIVKDDSHPYYGQGGHLGYAINGQQDFVPVLERGKTYGFEIDTGVAHDFYVATQAKGWGMHVLRKEVEGNFTYSGMVTITPGKETPDVLYGGCRNHQYMGGEIKVVDKK